MVLADVYQGLGRVPRGSVKELRIVQIFPKTTHVANSPPIGVAAEENGRAILGTVPVEPDGSARFLVPGPAAAPLPGPRRDGFAYQTMRIVTYVQPGERVACVGCHENRMSAPIRAAGGPMALGRGPSPIDPGPLGGRPFSFVEIVQPVLDRHCVRCHGGEKTEGKIDLTRAPAGELTRNRTWPSAATATSGTWARTRPTPPRPSCRGSAAATRSRSPRPAGCTARWGSRLVKLLRKGHYDVRLGPDELRRLAAWIDLNAIFYGVNDPAHQARQLRGEAVPMPEMQ